MSPSRYQARSSGCWARSGLLLLMLLWALPSAANRSLLVVSDGDNATHQTIVERLRSAVDGQNGAAMIERLDAQQVTMGIPTNLAPDLIITVGARAAADVNGHSNGVPVLNVFLPKAAHQKINESSAQQTAAIVLDQPVRRQLAVARALLPTAQRAGFLRGGDALSGLQALTEDAVGFGLALNITTVEGDDDPATAIQQVLATSDVVIATFDPQVYTPATAKWLLYLAFQRQRPIVGFSYALLKAGAVAAVFSTPEQIAQHAADLVGEWLRTGLLPSGTTYPRYYHIGLNAPVAKKLGIVTPSDDELEREVRELLGERP